MVRSKRNRESWNQQKDVTPNRDAILDPIND